MYADAAAQEAARELELRENDLRLINEQINALDESGVTRDDQIVLTENRVAAEREAAAAAAKLAELDQIAEETRAVFAADIGSVQRSSRDRDRRDASYQGRASRSPSDLQRFQRTRTTRREPWKKIAELGILCSGPRN